jgi:predicted phage terminase large subunit-like protein
LDVFDKAYEWFTYGARTRLMPGGRVAICQTRWHMDDLTGRLTRDMAQNELADKYEVVEFPAIFEIEKEVEERADPEEPNSPLVTRTKVIEKALWPEFYDINALHRTKASMPLFQWNAQYQQNPTAEEASVVKREWWNIWPNEDPPNCEYIIMSLDSAAETNNRADYTAITVWGVFRYEGDIHDREGKVLGVPDAYNIILLNSVKCRVEFPELKDLAHREYANWKPDTFIVEKKGSGAPLYQELRRSGLMVQEYTPHRGTGDKMARLNSVADIIRSRMAWVPQARWAEELVEEIAGFPFMSHDDLVDSTVMALLRFRQGGFLRLPSDEPEEPRYYRRRQGGYY